MAVFELGDNPGPAALGHDPIVAGNARKKALNAVEGTGAVSFRDDPALPWLNTRQASVLMSLADYLPYSSDYTVRKQIDELFSRKMLGAVLVGKFVGDLSAVIMTGFLGTYIGLGVGLVITISLFIYWERVEKATQKAKEKTEQSVRAEEQTRVQDFVEEEEELNLSADTFQELTGSESK